MIPDDLPKDLPSFIGRFGTDSQCRDYLFHARWPEGFRCAGCGHDDAYALNTKIVYECVACRTRVIQFSLLPLNWHKFQSVPAMGGMRLMG